MHHHASRRKLLPNHVAWTALRRPSEKSAHKQPELTDNVKRVLVEVGKRSLICSSWHFKSFCCGLGNTGISIQSWCTCCGVIELHGKHVEPIECLDNRRTSFACMSSIGGSLECRTMCCLGALCYRTTQGARPGQK